MLGEPTNEATNLLAGALYNSIGEATCEMRPLSSTDDLVGEGHGLDLIVRNVDHRRFEILMQLGQFEAHLNPQHGVEI